MQQPAKGHYTEGAQLIEFVFRGGGREGGPVPAITGRKSALHPEGTALIDSFLNVVRKEAEGSNCLQGFVALLFGQPNAGNNWAKGHYTKATELIDFVFGGTCRFRQ